MKYAYTIIYVKDVPKTLTFYKKAFGLEKKFLTPENDYGKLVSGEVTLAFASIELGKSNLKKGFQAVADFNRPLGVELVFTTERIEVDFKKAVEAGAVEYAPIEEKSWGQKVGYVLDNNGFLIEICTPLT